MVYGGITGAVLYGQLHEISSLAYPLLGIPLSAFGYISLAFTLAGGGSGIVAPFLRKRFSYGTLSAGILALSAALLFLFGHASRPLHLVYLIACVFALELISPLTSGYIQRHADDRCRVTVSSLDAFLLHGLTMATSLTFGFVADRSGIFAGFRALAWLLFISGVVIGTACAWLAFRRSERT